MRRLPNPWVTVPTLAAAVAGYYIGGRVAGASCGPQGCPGQEFVGGALGAFFCAAGVLVVVVLAIRSLAEWAERGDRSPPGEGPS